MKLTEKDDGKVDIIAVQGKTWELYIGWRPDTRALGIALRRRHKI